MVEIGLYGGDYQYFKLYQNYFKFMVEIFSILKDVKTFLICRKNTKKNDENDMTADMVQRERNNIKCYA